MVQQPPPPPKALCQWAARWVLLTVDLLTGDALNVDHPLLAVHLGDLALTALRAARQHEGKHTLQHPDCGRNCTASCLLIQLHHLEQTKPCCMVASCMLCHSCLDLLAADVQPRQRLLPQPGCTP